MNAVTPGLQQIGSHLRAAAGMAPHAGACLLKLDLNGAAASMKAESASLLNAGRALQDMLPASRAANALTGGALAKLQDKGAALSQKFFEGMIDAGMGSLQDMKTGTGEVLKGAITLDPQRASAGVAQFGRGALTAAEFASGEGIALVAVQVGAGVVADEVGNQAQKVLNPHGDSVVGGAIADALKVGSQVGIEALAASRGKVDLKDSEALKTLLKDSARKGAEAGGRSLLDSGTRAVTQGLLPSVGP